MLELLLIPLFNFNCTSDLGFLTTLAHYTHMYQIVFLSFLFWHFKYFVFIRELVTWLYFNCVNLYSKWLYIFLWSLCFTDTALLLHESRIQNLKHNVVWKSKYFCVVIFLEKCICLWLRSKIKYCDKKSLSNVFHVLHFLGFRHRF